MRKTTKRRTVKAMTEDTSKWVDQGAPAPANAPEEVYGVLANDKDVDSEPSAFEQAEAARPRIEMQDRPQQHHRQEYFDAKDPRLHTRAIRERKEELQKAKQKGYVPIKADELATHSGIEMPDGCVRAKDRVVMACLKEDYQGRIDERTREHLATDKRRQAAAEALAQDGHDGGGLEKSAEHGQRRGSKFISIP